MLVPDLLALPDEGALLGLDPGSRRIGVAACDPRRSIVSAIDTIARTRLAADLEAIFGLYDSRGCVGMVVGLPLNMDGSEGPRAQSARAFARNILKRRDVPVALHDERLSSAQADDLLREAGLNARRRQSRRDATAAAIILQSALDARAAGRG